MRTRSSILGTELHSDREPEVFGARVAIQGTFPPEELFPAFVLCLPSGIAVIYPQDSRNDYVVVCDGVLYKPGAMGEEFLRRANGQRGESEGLDPVLSYLVRESA